jgi:hypothetical protein
VANHQKNTARHIMALPSFLVEKPIGLGEVIKRVTARLGAEPCQACGKRAEQLNRWVRFVPREQPPQK